MDLQKISLEPLKGRRIAILGYGNQGRAHALNLRDSGLEVLVGGRPGKSLDQASKEGFSPLSYAEAARQADIVMFLLSDPVIGTVYQEVKPHLLGFKAAGFAHGFAYHYGQLEPLAPCAHFLVGPKGAGAILRRKFEAGSGLPGVFAIGKNATEKTKELVLAYAKGIGVAHSILLETSFQEETECDLFGEQVVLCGGIPQLMEAAYETLVKNGLSPEMAFFECCYEAKLILDLWLTHGPRGMADKISPTAFFGGMTRGKRLVTPELKAEMERIFSEIRRGDFARDWLCEVKNNAPLLQDEKARLENSPIELTYRKLSEEGLKLES